MKIDLDTRNCLVADPGCLLVGADYSQIESRVIATLAEERTMVQSFIDGRDIHKTVASSLWGVDYDDVLPDQRSIAKNCGYAMIYGSGPKKLALMADIPVSEAKAVIDLFYKTFPKLKAYQKGLSKQRTIITPFGRELPIDRARQYAATNYMVQSTARDLFVIGGVRIIQAGYGGMLWLPIHDEWILNVPEHYAEQVANELTDLMYIDFYGTPIVAEGQVLGECWRKGD